VSRAYVSAMPRSTVPSDSSLSLRAVVYDTLLALHLVSAAISFVTVVMFSAWAAGAPITRGGFALSDAAWNLSGAGLLIFGVWLALYVDGYELWDGWILAALALFAAVSVFGAQARTQVLGRLDAEAATVRQVTIWHWLRTVALVGILVLMVWKPGA
jgi:hypothetical protein